MALCWLIKPPNHYMSTTSSTEEEEEDLLRLNHDALNLHLTDYRAHVMQHGVVKVCEHDLQGKWKAAHLLNQGIIDLYSWLDIGHHLLGDLS